MSTYEISKSSLLSLKAEILRKQQELTKAKNDNEIKIKELKKNIPLELKNKGVEARDEADREIDEDLDLLKQSRSQLEFKSLLYERLSQGKLSKEQQIINKQYLVQFDKKNKSNTSNTCPDDSEDQPDKYPESESDYYNSDDDNVKDPGEKWVEYVDCLGRTRKCLQKDLEYLKSKDTDLQKVVEAKKKSESENVTENEDVKEKEDVSDNPNINQEFELLSSDMRREILRQQWEKEEEDLKNKSNIHYQDVLFGEARTHGVGYYGFSKDEEERLRQQESLKKLREETEKKQQKAQNLKNLREKQLAARIKAAKDRKRARLGLPPEEEEEEKKEPENTQNQISEHNQKDVQAKEAIEKLLDEARKKHIRPWDIGKDGVKSHYEMTQVEWVDKKRSERDKEFAPPSTYVNFNKTTKKIDSNNKKPEKNETIFEKKTNKQRSQVKSTQKPRLNKQWENNTSNLNTPNRLLVDRNESVSEDKDYSSSENESRTNGIEIAPPPTYEYYEPSSKILRKSSTKPNPINIQESIEAGLKFLRTQAEKKKVKK